ncbi:hypothetical protein Tco_0638975, partial [Tanacetum coccineum]
AKTENKIIKKVKEAVVATPLPVLIRFCHCLLSGCNELLSYDSDDVMLSGSGAPTVC